ncbi:hypothetical protein [Nonomuraea sp. JJY05]|uniref:hypothetical protein n=1 Tax=Nonomuraea sp. JJY05 TaxID=3350255 RepID=UPI00373E7B34
MAFGLILATPLLGVGLAPVLVMVLRPSDPVAFAVSPAGVGLGYVVAVLVTVLAAYASSRRAAAIPPIAALRAAPEPGRTRSLLGVLLPAGGLIGVVATAAPGEGTVPRIVALASAAVGATG